MQNKNRKELKAENQKQKTKQKKNGKVAAVYAMHQKGVSAKDIAQKMGLDVRVVGVSARATSAFRQHSILSLY